MCVHFLKFFTCFSFYLLVFYSFYFFLLFCLPVCVLKKEQKKEWMGEVRRIWKEIIEGKYNHNILSKNFYFQQRNKIEKKNLSDLIVYGLYIVTKVSGQWSGSLSEDWDLEWKVMVHLFLEMGMCMEPATLPFS